MTAVRLKGVIKKYCPTPALVLFCAAVISGIVHLISEFSQQFSDFVNRYISTVIRAIPAMLTSILPFSAAETFILSIPILLVLVVLLCSRAVNKSVILGIRFVVSMASVVALLYSMFVFSTAVAYNGTPLADKLGLRDEPVSADELRVTAEYMIDKISLELDGIEYLPDGSSSMPYSVNEMNRLLLKAYDRASDKYSFIPRLSTRVKPIALSEPMTYTHISGIYTYFTGESNININFPDYTLPYTAAHELAHQRGILPEDEANFVAFLVCCESEDPYIRYSGYMNIYQYLNSALYDADSDMFSAVYRRLDSRAVDEMIAYNEFFEKYRENKAADISSALNDNYLKAQGESAGEKSYGMVVDLAVAYVADEAR